MRILPVALAVLSFSVLPAAAQQQIGTTKSVKPAAHGSVAGTLSVGSGVHANETIGTDKAGVAGLRVPHERKMGVWAETSVCLHRFIYLPHTGTVRGNPSTTTSRCP